MMAMIGVGSLAGKAGKGNTPLLLADPRLSTLNKLQPNQPTRRQNNSITKRDPKPPKPSTLRPSFERDGRCETFNTHFGNFRAR